MQQPAMLSDPTNILLPIACVLIFFLTFILELDTHTP